MRSLANSIEARSQGGLDALLHLWEYVPARDLLEDIGAGGVEAHVDPLETRLPQLSGFLHEMEGVRRHGHLLNVGGDPADYLDDVLPEEGLAACQLDLPDS
jgi:hypothetical protein